MDGSVELRVADRVAHVRLHRPDVGNAINVGMANTLLAIALECSARDEIRAVLLTASGKNFCVGGDIRVFAAAGDKFDAAIREIVVPLHAAVGIFGRMSAPVVAAVQGVSAGGGLALALSADVTLASRSATFKASYTGIGLSGDVGITYTLPRAVGLRRARHLLLTNRLLTADEAYDWGIVDQVLDDDHLQDEAMALAKRLADGPPLAFEACKNLLHGSFGASFEEQMAREAMCMTNLAMTSDARSAVQAFLDKRPPVFEGR